MAKTKRLIKNLTNKTKKKLVKINNYKKGICDIPSYIKFIKNYNTDLQLIRDDKELKQSLLIGYNKNKIEAKNDFYNYINDKWLHNKEIYNTDFSEGKKYIIQMDDFRIVQDKVIFEIDTIIKNYIHDHKDKKSKCMSNFYKAITNKLHVKLAKQKTNEIINYLDEMRKDKNNIWKLLAHINQNEAIKSIGPYVWNVVQNKKHSKYFISEISPKIFVISNFEAYYKDTDERRKFNNYVKNIFKAMNFKCDRAEDVFDIGVEFFNCFSYAEFKNDPNGYNLIHKNEALEKYGFDWITFTKELGYKSVPEHFVATDINYLKAASQLITENWNSDKWRPWWVWLLTKRLTAVTDKWENENAKYYGKEGQGRRSNVFSVRPSLYTSLAFNTTISEIYIKSHLDQRKVDYIKVFIEDLKEMFIKIVTKNKWMNKNTTDYAIKKIESLKFLLVSPPYLAPDPLLDYREDDVWYNVEILMKYRANYYISMDGKPFQFIPSVDWNQYPIKFSSFQCYIVNAQYVPTLNSIYIPLGYIQEPFIDLEKRGIEYNLSNVGFTIAHEMAHSLDENGSKYDIEGNLHDWWSTQDKQKYKKIQLDVINQYNTWARKDGIKYDATSSIGEDIADITSLNVCDNYLLYYLNNKKSLTPIIANSFNTFHIYFASHQKQKISKMAEKSQLISNPHPPNKYRCNVPLSRSVAFISNYNIKKGDGMWWHNQKPIW